MSFKFVDGLSSSFADGIVDPVTSSQVFRENSTRYRELTNRVFLLYEPPNASSTVTTTATFDIVFLHGVGSDEFSCWTNKKGVLWPAVFVPQDFPTCRVLTVGYAHSLWNWGSVTNAAKEGPPLADAAVSGVSEGSATRQGLPHGLAGAEEALRSSTMHLSEFLQTFVRKASRDGGGKGGLSEGLPHPDAAPHAPSAGTLGDRADVRDKLPPHTYRHTVRRLLLEAGALFADDPAGDAACTDAEDLDPRTMQSVRLVAADTAARLLSPEVDLGRRPVVFITHSMGGLVAKQLLVFLSQTLAAFPVSLTCQSRPSHCLSGDTSMTGPRSSACDPTINSHIQVPAPSDAHRVAIRSVVRLLHAVRGVVFYSTPHFGSGLASVITGLQRYYHTFGGPTPTHVVTGLGEHNRQQLTRLNDQFTEVVGRSSEWLNERMSPAYEGCHSPFSTVGGEVGSPGIEVLSFGETRRLHGLVLVVDPVSANPAPGDARFLFFLLDADHSTVNRPLTKTSPSYAILFGLLDRMQQRGRLHPISRDALGTSMRLPVAQKTAETSDGPAAELRERTTEKQSKRREEVWESLFSVTLIGEGDAVEARQRPTVPHQVDVSCPPDGSTLEVFVWMRTLEGNLHDLRGITRTLFGRLHPQALSRLFFLSADVIEFVQHYADVLTGGVDYTGSQQAMSEGWASGDGRGLSKTPLTAFVIPLRLVLHWTRYATEVLQGFQYEQSECVTPAESGGAGSTAQGSGVSLHLSASETRKMEDIVYGVGALQGEWESFRRHMSLLLREACQRPVIGSSSQPSSVRPPQGKPCWATASLESTTIIIFFARTMRLVMEHKVHDGGCLSSILGHYVDSTVERAALLEAGGSDFPYVMQPLLRGGHPVGQDTASRAALQHFRDGLVSRLVQSGGRDSNWMGPSVTSCPLVLGDTEFSAAALAGEDTLLGDEASVPWRGVPSLRSLLMASACFLLGCYYHVLGESVADRRWGRMYLHQALRNVEARRRALAQSEVRHKTRPQSAGEGVDTAAAKSDTRGTAHPADWVSTKIGKLHPSAPAREARRRDEIFSALLELVAWSLICLSCLRSLAAVGRPYALLLDSHSNSKRFGAMPSVDEGTPVVEWELSEEGRCLLDAVQGGRRAYDLCERALDGGLCAEDAMRPFHSSAPNGIRWSSEMGDLIAEQQRSADRNDASAPSKQTKALEEVKTILQQTVGRLWKALEDGREGVSDGGGPSSSGTDAVRKRMTAQSKPTGMDAGRTPRGRPVKPRSLMMGEMLVKMLLNAWLSVREGGEGEESPDHCARNAFVMWWILEEEVSALVAACTRLAASRPLMGHLQRAFAHNRKGPPEMHEASRTADAAAATASSSLSLCSTAHPNLKGQLLAAKGRGQLVEAEWEWLACQRARLGAVFQDDVEGLPGAVAAMELAKEAQSKSRATGTEAPPHVSCSHAVMQGALSAAIMLDRNNATARCLMGHYYLLYQRPKKDAAHEYASALQGECCSESSLYCSAEAGLGWVHLYNLSDNQLSTVWGGTYKGARGEIFQGGHPSVLLDPLSRRQVPLEYWSFCDRAIDVLQGFPEAHTCSTPSTTSLGQRVDPERQHMHPLHPTQFVSINTSTCEGHRAASHHMLLSERYFRSVLRKDPCHVGALCGLGRLNTLVLDRHHNQHAGAPDSVTSRRGCLRDLRAAEQYFRQVMQIVEGDMVHSPGDGPPASFVHYAEQAEARLRHFCHGGAACRLLDPVMISYAAYWLGDLHYPLLSYEEEMHLAQLYYADAAAVMQGRVITRGRTSGISHALSHMQVHKSAVYTAQSWYLRSLSYYPSNDWALARLGLLYCRLARAQMTPFSELIPSSSVSLVESLQRRDTRRGLLLLNQAMTYNPCNYWALWGMATYGTDVSARKRCQGFLWELCSRAMQRTPSGFTRR